MASLDPFEKSITTSLKNIFDKKEDEVLCRILDTKVFTDEPLPKDSHKRGFNEGRRKVFRHWPRDPNGKVLDDIPEGKFALTSTPLWAASLYDFYFVNRIPDCGYHLTISTGSKLAQCMKKIGELAHAENELDWAAHQEPDPEVRHASDIGGIIECRELMIMLRSYGTSLRLDDEFEEDDQSKEERDKTGDELCSDDKERGGVDKKDDKMNVDEGSSKDEDSGEENKAASMCGLPKPFDYANYPMPWPLVPFSSKSPKLESPIPYHLLPEKLIVHDPFGILHAAQKFSDDYDYDDHEDDFSNMDWKSKPDVTYTYSLRLMDSVKKIITQERKKIDDAAANDPPVLFTLWPSHDSQTDVPAAVEVTVSPPPPPPSCTSEAHLYVSPKEVVGRGNHSLVYRAEWDLPKSVFFKPTICETCVREAALGILRQREEKKKELEDSADNSDPSTMGRFVIRTKEFPSLEVHLVRNPDDFQKDDLTAAPSGILKRTQELTYMAYEGPKTRVHVDSVPWYTVGMDPEPCNHRVSAAGPLPRPAPPSAQVSVVAKISLPKDPHLTKEAVNYQRFGPHMSEHWTGYNVARPLIEPTPVGAITPNFYGYYVKDVEQGDEVVTPEAYSSSSCDRSKYFSPIMLLEDCGTPINVSSLSLDDRRECAALLLRFHHLGWYQGSFAPRNILMRRGDHADFPLVRSSQDKRFRLIDFGRARSSEDAKNDVEWQSWDSQRFQEKNSIWQVMEFPYPV